MKALSKSPGGGEGFIKTLSMEHLENFCTQIGATESTYSTSYFLNTSNATSGFRLCLRGGRAYYGGLCGLSTLSVSTAVSDSNVYCGAALNLTRYCRLVCLAAEISGVRPCLMAKHTL